MDTLDGEGPVRLAGATPVSEQDWEAAAAAVLRKAGRIGDDAGPGSAWDALAVTTVEGLVVPPLGTAGRLARQGGPVAPVAAAVPAGRGDDVRVGWDIRPLLIDPDPGQAAAAALTDLENGGTSLWVAVGGAGTAPGDLDAALAGVFLELVPIVVSAHGHVTDAQAAVELAELFHHRGVKPDPGSCLGVDPVGRAVRTGQVSTASADLDIAVADIVPLATRLGVRALVVDGTAAHRSGAGDAAEVGFTLAAGVQYLRAMEAVGVAIDDALPLLEFRYAATDEQFPTIAKFRAARSLWQRVGELSGARGVDRGGVGRQFQHAVTSAPMLTRYDPWVNLLRTTVAAFAAGVGGADAVTVLPFDSRLGVPDALGRRMARNTSSLLISESHVAAVTDPAAGSFAVEMLTTELAEAAWTEFQRIESAGGILAALTDGSVQSRWAATSAERERRIATRRRPVTGVSEFPHLRETLPPRRSAPVADEDATPGWADAFESMRDRPAPVPVFLATLGTVAEHAARAGFAANLFAAGGVDSVTAGATVGVDDVITTFRDSGAAVACLAGTDKAYAAIGLDAVQALRSAGARWVVLAGRPTGALDGVVDDHVAAGEDVVQFLTRTREHLQEGQVAR